MVLKWTKLEFVGLKSLGTGKITKFKEFSLPHLFLTKIISQRNVGKLELKGEFWKKNFGRKALIPSFLNLA